MTVMHSLKEQGLDPVARLTEVLDALARDPTVDTAAFLFPPATPPAPLRIPAPTHSAPAEPEALTA